VSDQKNGWRSEAARIGDRLIALAQSLQELRRSEVLELPSHDDLLARLMIEIEARSRRRRIFGTDLLSDPAWDILLDLTHAKLTGSQVSVSNACIGSFSPQTTGLRYVGRLVEIGYAERRRDPMDGRRIFLTLTDEGLALMNAYFSDDASALGAAGAVLSWLANAAVADTDVAAHH